MKRACLVLAFFVHTSVSMPSPAAAQPSNAWRDPSPHSATTVRVEPGVQLEVLDWGGSGRPVLLLAGLGDTAHVFDEFAPTLTWRHRVYALTRRGFGNSSIPETGYDFDRLAEDVIDVVRVLGLENPIIVGHSLAGEEMHVLGHRYPAEVAGLVYIDAAFDRADAAADYVAKFRELPRAPQPRANDRRSIATLRDFNARNRLLALPEAALRDRYVANAEGAISAPVTPAPAVREGLTAAMAATSTDYHPEPIRVPAMAIYAVPAKSADLMEAWYDETDPSVQRKVEEFFALSRDRFRRNAEWFRRFAQASPRVVEVAGLHHLFITNPAEVREAIETFSSALE